MRAQRWIVVADSPFLPARGGGEREHLGFLRAAARSGRLALLVLPGAEPGDVPTYRRELGDVPVIVTSRRTSPLMLVHPTQPYVVASRPAPRRLAARARALAPDATGIVVFSYKSRRIGEVLARGLGLPAVLRQHNREGAYHRSLAAGTPGPRGLVLRWEAFRIERDEQRVGRAGWLRGIADISLADATWRTSTGARNVVHVPPFALDLGPPPVDSEVDAATLPRAATGVPRVIFLGALDIATNTDALTWLIERVWPRVAAGHPDVVLDVVGRGPSAELTGRLSGMTRVRLAADVPDVRPYLAGADVAVNPAVSGSGVNIKVIEYLDAAIPLVSTGLATLGLPLRAGLDLEVQDAPDGFADAVLRLLHDPEAARTMGKQGQVRVREILDPAVNLDRIATMLES
ncbi:MAG TPA: glycosyltransferase [Kineosporiaceae bacterium]|nr:glycosyltransferase [Kineosporiaceae bacterium]